MAKKNKSATNTNSPNAPELHQILLDSPSIQHPPHNPYYPSLPGESSSSHYVPPPPYSDLGNKQAPSLPMTTIQQGNSLGALRNQQHYHGMPRASMPQQATVIVQQPTVTYYDRKREKRNRSIRSFNNQMILTSLIIIVFSIFANGLFIQRPCVKTFIVHRPTKDISLSIEDVNKAHLFVAYASLIVLGVCIAKCGRTNANSHGCYVFTILLLTFSLTLATGYLAYLAFYSPCTENLGQVSLSGAKSIVTSLFKDMPDWAKSYFDENNVFRWHQEDHYGLWIFLIDLLNFVSYLSAFLSALSLA